jgi:hypothetical protein
LFVLVHDSITAAGAYCNVEHSGLVSLGSTTFTAATLAHLCVTIKHNLLVYGRFILLITCNPSVTNEFFKPIPCNGNKQNYNFNI